MFMSRKQLPCKGCICGVVRACRVGAMLSVFLGLGFIGSEALAVPGSCCEQDGTCSVVEPAVCTGIFLGGVDCGPIGACCDVNGACSLQFEGCCQGTWHPQDCLPPEACCLPDATGAVGCWMSGGRPEVLQGFRWNPAGCWLRLRC